ncbi:helix-turn-helix transcriptional regulator [Arthrobacter sp. ISL-30]|uniref:helix-turn-helix domain-containing protein n=1 Tax=Arthrobacter sp. ISL-30 TaxID=2819109 RepID=UPI001BEB9787|nr:helix-turn-helix transcriptional regulator [Arthrobacter sp. ISL-30]MBT2514328.1 helix-turn-helix transcriptional regulator [Arthrobacter sp. ISL-30]
MNLPGTALDLGRSAYAEHRWSDALAHFSEAEREGGIPPQDLERLATVAILLGHSTEGIDTLTRAHEEFLLMGDIPSAARCAGWLVMHFMNQGEKARSSGWLSRGQRLLGELEETCPEEGFLLIPVALGTMYGGDPHAAAGLFGQALGYGKRFNDKDISALAQLGQGTSRIILGFRDEGLALLDEAMVAVTAGEVSPIPSGIIYCAVIGSCRMAFDVQRAQEWTAALDHWCGGRPDMVMFSGQCQSHRAELYILHGAWEEALAATRIAQDRAGRGDGWAAFGAYYHQGEVERLRGDFAAAEESYRRARQGGYEPQPGLALLRLAQGKISQAQSLIGQAVEMADPTSRRTLLPSVVEIELAAGQVPAARAAADELAASENPKPLEQAIAAQAEGAVLLEEGDPAAALRNIRRAWSLWRELEAPFEAARCRVLVGRAFAALGDPDTALMEYEAAKTDFLDLGAAPAAMYVDSLTGNDRVGKSGPLTAREVEVLRLVAAGKANRMVAAELYLSEKTVARHVSNIFMKLGVQSRVAATKYAYDHGLFH